MSGTSLLWTIILHFGVQTIFYDTTTKLILLLGHIEVAAEGTSGENIFSLTDKGPYSKNVPP